MALMMKIKAIRKANILESERRGCESRGSLKSFTSPDTMTYSSVKRVQRTMMRFKSTKAAIIM